MKLSFVLLSFLFTYFSAFPQNKPKDYTQTIPGTTHTLDMIGVLGGKFTMGSPEGEMFRKADEGPQRTVELSPFWIAKYETTWDLYLVFQNKELEAQALKTDEAIEQKADAVARPTKPYVEMSFGQGKNDGFPVCNATQFAARAFCEWLYKKTGEFYRLPTEAEWEYAARAGSDTPYYFGESDSDLGEYGWFFDNSDGAYKKVGQKKPNAWGLYDMYGNVAEWTSDQYVSDIYKNADVKDPYVAPTTVYPHVIRGGHWDDDPEKLRSAARTPSTPRLKQQDPQIPKSDWWLTDAPFVGFRVVRPLIQPSKEEIEKYFVRPPKDM
jgi:formylglycine-generating enzyme required for sulfatase activity